MNTERDVHEFWAWFVEHGDRIREDPLDDLLLAELDRRVRQLGCPAWEIGPGDFSEWFLALSPDGDPVVHRRTQYVVDRAPDVSGWSFLPHRPRKDWNLQFEVEGETGAVEIDARNWRYVAYRYPDGVYDIVVNVGDQATLTPADRALAVRVAVEGQLGEEALLTSINEIEAVLEFAPAEAANSRPLASLRKLV